MFFLLIFLLSMLEIVILLEAIKQSGSGSGAKHITKLSIRQSLYWSQIFVPWPTIENHY